LAAALLGNQQGCDPDQVDRLEGEERLILVDSRDQVRGYGGKLEVHRAGQLHRAFSIFIFDDQGRLLLQRRADCKYHFARLWSNTCCGHPRPEERTSEAARRRLAEELGFTVPLSADTELIYQAGDPATGLVEHEYLHVFRGHYGGRPQPDPAEVGAWRWLSPERIHRLLQRQPQWFTPWFALLFRRLF